MLTINVAPDGSGQFTTISEAVLAVPYDCPAVIRIAPGIYREKLVCEKRISPLRARAWMPPGWYGTMAASCRTRTGVPPTPSAATPPFSAGEAAGGGYDHRERCRPRRKGGTGHRSLCGQRPGGVQPRAAAGQSGYPVLRPSAGERAGKRTAFWARAGWHPRRASAQYYHACEIAGDIDFIFGGADALFEHCTLRTVDNGLAHSWVTAPSGAADGMGFVFWDCDFVSDCPAGSVYLGRPWRPTGKTAVLDCRLGAHIAPEGFAGWNDRTDTALAGFAEAGSTGAGAGERPGWVQALSAAEAAALLRAARQKCRMETTERITE